jgi:hypothetical protein
VFICHLSDVEHVKCSGDIVQDDMNCAEDNIKYLWQHLLDNCLDEMSF